jgi:type 1 glutamine amidotransferase/sugar phosphate isomerase/epimerase
MFVFEDFAMIKRLAVPAFIATLLFAQGPRPGAKSQRPADTRRVRTSVTRTLGWNLGIPSSVFPALTFYEAAGMADALGLGSIELADAQKVSPSIDKNLDYNLSADEIASVKARLTELRLKAPAYRVNSIENASAAQRVFALAKALSVETIVAPLNAALLPEIDRAAAETGVNLAIDAGPDIKGAMQAIEGRSTHIGVSADVGQWLEAGIVPADTLPLLKGRLMVVHLRDRDRLGSRGNDVVLGDGVADVSRFLMDVVRAAPPIKENRNKCLNCSVGYDGAQQLFVAIDARLYPAFQSVGVNGGSGLVFGDLWQSIQGFEQAVRPAMGYRVEQDSAQLPPTSPDTVPAEERKAIEAGVPRRALATPRKPRKLLVLDLSTFGEFHHASVAHTNLAIQLMARNTGAFEPVFSNDLNNLKYPAVTQFDGVLFNSTVGELLIDPEVIGGLTRFVRDGGGVIGIHAGTYSSMDVPEFGEMMGAFDGPHRVEPATLKIEDLSSPLTRGFGGESSFAYTDEFYHFIPNGPFSRDKLHVLISIDTGKSDMSRWNVRPDNDYGLVWIKSYGKGRVFNSALGHMPTFYATPALAQMVLGGIQFALGDLDADTTPSALLSVTK